MRQSPHVYRERIFRANAWDLKRRRGKGVSSNSQAEKKQISKLRQKGNGSAKKSTLNGGRGKAVIEDGMEGSGGGAEICL
jgi:hypothetical protein